MHTTKRTLTDRSGRKNAHGQKHFKDTKRHVSVAHIRVYTIRKIRNFSEPVIVESIVVRNVMDGDLP